METERGGDKRGWRQGAGRDRRWVETGGGWRQEGGGDRKGRRKVGWRQEGSGDRRGLETGSD